MHPANTQPAPAAPPVARSGEGIASILAKNLVAARNAAGVTQQELADSADVSRATIAQLEAGLGDPKLSTVHLLAKALKVPPLLLVLGVNEVEALNTLIETVKATPAVEALRTADLPQLQRLVRSGLLKDRSEAARVCASAARSIGLAEDAAVGAAIGAAIRPGAGAVVGTLLTQLLADQKAAPAALPSASSKEKAQ